ncbi:MAG: hypothetical protein K2Q01_09580 [Rickettsiales bacterium]|nr:hypothetical protein [Rickettsiales bacterium]
MPELHTLFRPDALSGVMLAVLGFVYLVVASFASRHLQGDRARAAFFLRLALLAASVGIMVCADHLLVLLLSWGLSNALLVRLMVHKSGWAAARASGWLAARNFLLGFLCVATAFNIFYISFHQSTVSGLLAQAGGGVPLPALALLLIGALTQSAIWPFHRWLLSSTNAPTPVSALMHAGLVNGGGFLLARFAPLFIESPYLLDAMFALGLATALLGTLWKLIQPDIKRMLACSTMSQMGFMLMQCGLGLFPAAVAHLCCHGLFKAYLFLSSGGAAREKRLDLKYPPTLGAFAMSLFCGMAGGAVFAWVADKPLTGAALVLVAIAVMAGSQFALPMLREHPLKKLLPALLATLLAGAFYGLNVHAFEWLLAAIPLHHPQPLSALHLLGVALLALAWLCMLFGQPLSRLACTRRLYMAALNASQPHFATITAHRNRYQY